MTRITGVEIDMVQKDCLKALALYEQVFEVDRLEVTAFEPGNNEAVFTIYGVRFHMLDENPAYSLIAPIPEGPKPMWLNVAVPDIRATYAKAMALGCKEIQPVTEMADYGVINAVFQDPFGYLWMLHEIVRLVSFEERVQMHECDTVQ